LGGRHNSTKFFVDRASHISTKFCFVDLASHNSTKFCWPWIT